MELDRWLEKLESFFVTAVWWGKKNGVESRDELESMQSVSGTRKLENRKNYFLNETFFNK